MHRKIDFFKLCLNLTICSAFFIVSLPKLAEGNDTVISTVFINQEEKGYFFIFIEDDNLFLRAEDAETLGLDYNPEKPVEINGVTYIGLDYVSDIKYSFDAAKLALQIETGQSYLSTTVIEFTHERPKNIYSVGDDSAFLNYRFDYLAGNDLSFRLFSLTNEFGLYINDFFFRTDSVYVLSETENKFIRLTTNLTFDDRRKMSRIIAGDFFTLTGELASGLNMSGFSYSKKYNIDPYFIKQPMFGFTDFVSKPSEVEVYLDGVAVKREKISPGTFELRNISSHGGANDVEVVIKEPFKPERRLKYSFYFTDAILRKGYHEYSYNLGFIREEFGLKSNSYGDLAFSGFHRYGFSDSLTIAFWGEGTSRSYNFGPQLQYVPRNAGLVNLTLATSMDPEHKTGHAVSLSHIFQSPSRISTRVLFRGFTEDYSPLIDIADENVKYEFSAGLGYGTDYFGSASLDYTTVARYRENSRSALSLTYSVGLGKDINIFATVRRLDEDGSTDYEAFLGLTYYPWKETFLSATYSGSKDADIGTVSLQKNPPLGKGYGYRVLAASERTDAGSANIVNPSIQYNTRYGVYTGEYRVRYGSDGSRDETYAVTASGGFSLLGKSVRLSRPVTNSFGLVKVGDIEGVRVYHNNHEQGRTDSSGEVLIPDLAPYYNNLISIDGRDIPIEYGISEVSRNISPSMGSGSTIDFRVERIRAVTGVLKIKEGDEFQSAGYGEFSILMEGEEAAFPIGRGGEFYIEGISPGEYDGAISYEGKRCLFKLVVPEGGDILTDLGELHCEVSD